MQCLILSSGLTDYGHLLALASYRKAPFGVEHAFCLTPTDEDSHSATIVVLCFAIVCVCVCQRTNWLWKPIPPRARPPRVRSCQVHLKLHNRDHDVETIARGIAIWCVMAAIYRQLMPTLPLPPFPPPGL